MYLNIHVLLKVESYRTLTAISWHIDPHTAAPLDPYPEKRDHVTEPHNSAVILGNESLYLPSQWLKVELQL